MKHKGITKLAEDIGRHAEKIRIAIEGMEDAMDRMPKGPRLPRELSVLTQNALVKARASIEDQNYQAAYERAEAWRVLALELMEEQGMDLAAQIARLERNGIKS